MKARHEARLVRLESRLPRDSVDEFIGTLDIAECEALIRYSNEQILARRQGVTDEGAGGVTAMDEAAELVLVKEIVAGIRRELGDQGG